jgi:hypothetical protein
MRKTRRSYLLHPLSASLDILTIGVPTRRKSRRWDDLATALATTRRSGELCAAVVDIGYISWSATNKLTGGFAVPAVAILSKRQFADVDHARSCPDRNFEMICLYDVRNVARAVRDNVDTGPESQNVVEQAHAT